MNSNRNKNDKTNPFETLVKLMRELKQNTKCMQRKCKEAYTAFQNKKKLHDKKIMKIILDKKISLEKKQKMKYELINDLYKTKERNDMVKCQMQQCQKEVKSLLRVIFESPPLIYAKNNKKSPYYQYYKKYVSLLKKKNITYEDVKDMDIEHYKITNQIKI